MTAATIDSREFINARRRADAQVLLPKGTRIAFAGGVECNDHHRIWAVLDKVMAKHSDMVLLHGGTPRGADVTVPVAVRLEPAGQSKRRAGEGQRRGRREERRPWCAPPLPR
jgi:YspA, cpYpsA-related SLOG family